MMCWQNCRAGLSVFTFMCACSRAPSYTPDKMNPMVCGKSLILALVLVASRCVHSYKKEIQIQDVVPDPDRVKPHHLVGSGSASASWACRSGSESIPSKCSVYFFPENFNLLSKILKTMTPIPLMRIENNVGVYWNCCEYIKVKKNPDFPNMCKTWRRILDPQHVASGPSKTSVKKLSTISFISVTDYVLSAPNLSLFLKLSSKAFSNQTCQLDEETPPPRPTWCSMDRHMQAQVFLNSQGLNFSYSNGLCSFVYDQKVAMLITHPSPNSMHNQTLQIP
jgi:hypothetical protein